MDVQVISGVIRPYTFSVRKNVRMDEFYIKGAKTRSKNLKITYNNNANKPTSHIRSIYFEDCSLIEFPPTECLLQRARNLTYLRIINCKLTKITSEDLNGLESLTDLLLGYNAIKELPRSLFRYTPNLEIVSFRDNQIDEIDSEILNPLRKIRYFNLIGNASINVIYDGIDYCCCSWVSLSQLKELIKKCDSKLKKDFTVNVNGKAFKVGKKMLSTNSPVLANMIAKNGKSASLNLENLSEHIFERIIDFMQTSQPPNEDVNLIELFAVSARFEMKDLMDLVAGLLIDKITPGTERNIMELSKKFGYNDLHARASEVLKKRMADITSVVVYNSNYYSLDYLMSN